MGFNLEPAVYRYFTTDIVSNTLLAEIPFQGVSFGRALKGAGSFSGKIPVIDKTASFNLYDATMPGRTAIYATRNGECVWGGIIWSRQYNLISKELDINASEWTSYLHRRRIWKTWTHNLGATVVVSGGIGSVTLDPGFTYQVAAGSSVKVSFYKVSDFGYNGFYTVLSSPAPTPTTFSFTATGSTVRPRLSMAHTNFSSHANNLVFCQRTDFQIANCNFINTSTSATKAVIRASQATFGTVQDCVLDLVSKTGYGLNVGQSATATDSTGIDLMNVAVLNSAQPVNIQKIAPIAVLNGSID